MNHTSPIHAFKLSCMLMFSCTSLLLPNVLNGAEQGASKLGWTCEAAEDSEAWDCKRSGPISEQLAISKKEKASQQGASISPQDEARFQTLLTNLPVDPWAN